jgi:hypothetical protein
MLSHFSILFVVYLIITWDVILWQVLISHSITSSLFLISILWCSGRINFWSLLFYLLSYLSWVLTIPHIFGCIRTLGWNHIGLLTCLSCLPCSLGIFRTNCFRLLLRVLADLLFWLRGDLLILQRFGTLAWAIVCLPSVRCCICLWGWVPLGNILQSSFRSELLILLFFHWSFDFDFKICKFNYLIAND